MRTPPRQRTFKRAYAANFWKHSSSSTPNLPTQPTKITAITFWKNPMRIDFVALRELQMKLRSPFETSVGTTLDRRVLLVEVRSEGATGWAEITTPEGPFYNAETTDSAWHVFEDFIVPIVLGKTVDRAAEAPLLMRGIRGNEMARAGFE